MEPMHEYTLVYQKVGNEMNDFSVSICTFAVNEVASLRICVETILNTCDKTDIKEIIICTCRKTTGESRKTITALQMEHPDISIIEIEQPPESDYWGEACKVMFAAASGTHILSMTSDLECNPDFVRKLIGVSKKNPHALIKCSRWKNGAEFNGYGGVRKFGNRLFQRYMQLLFGKGVSDYTYSFQIAPATIFKETRFHKNGRTIAIELIAGPKVKGVPIIEIPFIWKKREEPQIRPILSNDLIRVFWSFIVALDIRFGCKENKT